MRLSEIKSEAELSDEQLTSLVYGEARMLEGNADVALLLGGATDVIEQRTLSAFKLWREGRVKYICPTGGVMWDTHSGKQSECDIMTGLLLDGGVPEDRIIRENEAQTTIENMIYGTLRIQREVRFDHVKSIVVVTSNSHLRRSKILGELFLPRSVSVSCYTAQLPIKEEWTKNDLFRKRVLTEARLLLSLYNGGQIDDIEF